MKTTLQPKRRPLRAAFFIGLCLLLLAIGLTLPGAWQETARREAYLPQLEAQALRSPTDGPLLALLGARRLESGEYVGAADALRQAIAAGESSETTWQALAGAVAASGDRGKAIADLRLGIKTLPDDTALQTALARARTADPNGPPPALALAILPDGPAPLLQTYAAGGRLNGLAEWWGRRHPESSGFATRRAWASEQPGSAQAQRLWGEALLQNRRAVEARPVLMNAVALAPQSPAANLALAQCLEQTGDVPKAELQYLACLKLRPDWLPALLGVGATASRNGLNSQALDAYTRATQTDAKSADAWIGVGRAQLKTGVAYDQALTAFETAARLAPGRTDYLDDYADTLRRSSRWDEAEALLRRRLAAAPDDALAHYLLGLVASSSRPTPDRIAEAGAQTREALRLSPHNPLADVQLAQLTLDGGQAPEAVALLNDSLASRPDDQKTLLLLARAYQQAGQPALAAQASARARTILQQQQRSDVLADQSRRNPLDAALHQQLADLYARLGRPDKARREADMARLIQSDPQRAAQEMDAFDTTVHQALQGR